MITLYEIKITPEAIINQLHNFKDGIERQIVARKLISHLHNDAINGPSGLDRPVRYAINNWAIDNPVKAHLGAGATGLTVGSGISGMANAANSALGPSYLDNIKNLDPATLGATGLAAGTVGLSGYGLYKLAQKLRK